MYYVTLKCCYGKSHASIKLFEPAPLGSGTNTFCTVLAANELIYSTLLIAFCSAIKQVEGNAPLCTTKIFTSLKFNIRF
ncbi:hypothetical protein D9981_11750 [Pseudoalteromonas phenolica O-BC30]|nr:hypothetical protein D9981_11750 [Pseudoalteromonas phenolica O-BC30]